MLSTSSAWNDIATVEISRRQRPGSYIISTFLQPSIMRCLTCMVCGWCFRLRYWKPTPWNVLNEELSILCSIPPTFCRYRQATRIKHKANTSHTSVLAHHKTIFILIRPKPIYNLTPLNLSIHPSIIRYRYRLWCLVYIRVPVSKFSF